MKHYFQHQFVKLADMTRNFVEVDCEICKILRRNSTACDYMFRRGAREKAKKYK